jgi:hypothetical protein
MINDSWCNCNNIQELKSFCLSDLEYITIKCRPYNLPREFSSVIVTAVYFPFQADTTTALKELHWTSCKLETIYPEVAFIVAGDFNKENLRKMLTKFYQHIDCSTHWTIVTLTSGMHTRLSPALLSASLTTTPFCSSLPIGRNSNRKYPC